MSVRELHNDIILPDSQVVFHGSINEYGKLCIGDMSVRKYVPEHIKPMSNINNIMCGFENCINDMLLQSSLNK